MGIYILKLIPSYENDKYRLKLLVVDAKLLAILDKTK